MTTPKEQAAAEALSIEAFEAWWEKHAWGQKEAALNAWRACWRYWLNYVASTPSPAPVLPSHWLAPEVLAVPPHLRPGVALYAEAYARKALASLPATHPKAEPAGVPEEWQLVPKEPTWAMKQAALEASRAETIEGDGRHPLPTGYELWSSAYIYRAMLSAAPAAPQDKDATQ